MKAFRILFLATTAAAGLLHAQSTSDFAPANLSSVIFNGTITSATGGANGAGTISSLLTTNGMDYTLAPGGMLSDPAAFSYAKTSPTAATLTEPAVGTLPSVSVALTFTSAGAGTFVATYGNGSTQQGSFTLAPIAFASPLTNVSTRTVLAANGSAITGFVIGGGGPRRVLIRAVGPGLSAFGVANALANPTITVWKNGHAVGSNDDFDSGANVDASLPQAFRQVGAFPLNAGSKDAAVVLRLDPGAYTAQIRGMSATDSGEVLLEVYFLD